MAIKFDRDQLIENCRTMLRGYVETITQPSKGKDMYVCPLCGSGTGAHGTGAFNVKGDKWKCFACDKDGDIFDLVGELEHIEDFNGRMKRTVEILGISDPSQIRQREENQKQSKTEQTEPETDFRDFFLQAHDHISETDYPRRRGLSQKTVDFFRLGFVPDWKHPKRTKDDPSPRMIIPVSRYSYLARYTGEGDFIDGNGNKLNKGKVKGKDSVNWIFNARILSRSSEHSADRPVFIVEGEIDAMSVYEVDGAAVALGSTSNTGAFIRLIDEFVRDNDLVDQPLIIALDNDDAGERAAEKLTEGLEKLSISSYRVNITGKYKDANEALINDREALRTAVAHAAEAPEEAETAEREAYLKNSTAHYIDRFIDGITASVNTPYIRTGFSLLDETLDGGLSEGLYIIGAISSLGKTTFVLQVADQIAQSGQDVLIFSLEMARSELMAKSISRHTSIRAIDDEDSSGMSYAKTARGITDGKRYQSYNGKQIEIINGACEDYRQYADRIFIVEGIGDVGVNEIRGAVDRHKRYTGRTPVIVIDYLQILAPYNERLSDKQNTDRAVLELKRISRDNKAAVIAVSSFNRENYSSAVNMTAFKESGAIEYSSDVLIGLQLAGAGEKGFDESAEKQRDPRIVELKILKNRNGKTGATIRYRYYPMFNLFEEAENGKDISESTGFSGGWTETSSSRKPSKRDEERADLAVAFLSVKTSTEDGEVTISRLADELDISQKQVKNRIKDLGGYIITGDIVTEDIPADPIPLLKPEPDDGLNW